VVDDRALWLSVQQYTRDVTPVEIVVQLCTHFAAATPCDERERESIEQFLAIAPTLESPFDEHVNDTHITGSAIVVGKRGVVLHLHKRLNIWLQPGGHIEQGETPAEGALREAREETGLDVRHPDNGPVLVHLDVHPGPRGHTHLDVRYIVMADDVEPAPGVDESQDVAWFAWDDAIAMADKGLVGALRVVRTYVR
jgi:8-oxo-dGTP pyrophosphatase MutT (NUDIX family)